MNRLSVLVSLFVILKKIATANEPPKALLYPESFVFPAWQDITLNCTALGFSQNRKITFQFKFNESDDFKHLDNLNNKTYETTFAQVSTFDHSLSFIAQNITTSLNGVNLTCRCIDLGSTDLLSSKVTKTFIIIDSPPLQPICNFKWNKDSIVVNWKSSEDYIQKYRVVIVDGQHEQIYNQTYHLKTGSEEHINVTKTFNISSSKINKEENYNLYLYLINVFGEGEPCIDQRKGVRITEPEMSPTLQSAKLPSIWVLIVVVIVGVILITACLAVSVAVTWRYKFLQEQKRKLHTFKLTSENKDCKVETYKAPFVSHDQQNTNSSVLYSEVLKPQGRADNVWAAKLETYATVQDSIDGQHINSNLSSPPLPPQPLERLKEADIKDLPGYGEVSNASSTPKRVLSARFSRTPNGSRNSQTPTSQQQVLPEYATVRDVVSRTHSLRTTPSVTSPSPLSPPPPQCSDLPVQDTVGYSTVADESKKIKRVRHGSHS